MPYIHNIYIIYIYMDIRYCCIIVWGGGVESEDDEQRYIHVLREEGECNLLERIFH